jgi:integrating conjugative element membrane protein (TIGR03747 family)
MNHQTIRAQLPALVAGQPGLIYRVMTLPFHLFGVLVGSLLISILIECLGMHLFWKDQSWHHAQDMMQYELSNLSDHFTRSVVVQEPGRTAARWVDVGYRWVFVNTGLQEKMNGAAARAKASAQGGAGDFRYFLGQAYVWSEAYLIAAAFTTITFAVRLLVLILTLPLFALAAFAGFVDGLVRRDVRRFGAGRESGFLYHRAKAALAPLAMLPWVVYLALPVSLNPLLILLPSAALLGLAVNLTTGSFKKYL